MAQHGGFLRSGLLALAAFGVGVIATAGLPQVAHAQKKGKFKVASETFTEGGTLKLDQAFSGMGCKGSNISPEIHWTGAPDGTQSYAVTMFDPDAPTGSGWWHWIVYNIPASVTSLPQGAGDSTGSKLPDSAAQGRTDFGKAGYGGPCPPAGAQHHYVFTVYALRVPTIDVDKDATAAMVSFYIHANALGSAKVTAVYGW